VTKQYDNSRGGGLKLDTIYTNDSINFCGVVCLAS